MKKQPSSIFNDVLGPVMRGPSSSHVAGAARLGSIVRQSLDGEVASVTVDFDINGSLAESYHGHGSDIGFVSGILGLALTDKRVPDACVIAQNERVNVEFLISDYGAEHPNHYRITAKNKDQKTYKWEGISVGGGMVEMITFNDFPVSIVGGFYELLVTFHLNAEAEIVKMILTSEHEEYQMQKANDLGLINVKFSQPISAQWVSQLQQVSGVVDICQIDPILPTRSKTDCHVPFSTATQLLEFAQEHDWPLWKMATYYESIRGNSTEEAVFQQMDELVSIMENCIEEGLKGTEYKDRILGPQAYKISEGQKSNLLIPNDLLNNVTKYITAIMEVKSAMGVIVAAPTAGSCGSLPGTLIGVARTLGLPRQKLIEGMLVAGLIGVFFAENATFAAEVAGCQVECGAGSGMAAAGITQMLDGSVVQCVDAASMALQNITGLACDPVANRVEVPCLGKNIMCGMNAIACANMAVAGFDKVVPLDETINAILNIGNMLPIELRCTLGGLGETPASWEIRKHLT